MKNPEPSVASSPAMRAEERPPSILTRIDARWFVFLNNTILLFAGRQALGLQRDPAQIVSCFVAGAVTEIALARLTRKHTAWKITDRLLSSSVAAASILVLLRSEYSWFYALAASIAVLSKYAVTDDLGRHVFWSFPRSAAVGGVTC